MRLRKIRYMKEKTVNKKVDHVIAPIASIPKQTLKEYKHNTLCIDVMFINSIKFLLTVSCYQFYHSTIHLK